jgi:hypothetical protein
MSIEEQFKAESATAMRNRIYDAFVFMHDWLYGFNPLFLLCEFISFMFDALYGCISLSMRYFLLYGLYSIDAHLC